MSGNVEWKEIYLLKANDKKRFKSLWPSKEQIILSNFSCVANAGIFENKFSKEKCRSGFVFRHYMRLVCPTCSQVGHQGCFAYRWVFFCLQQKDVAPKRESLSWGRNAYQIALHTFLLIFFYPHLLIFPFHWFRNFPLIMSWCGWWTNAKNKYFWG